jgi:multicomponent Na+:H+ antiporter subunit D
MMQHLPALQVLIPLTLAPLCFLFRNNRLAWFFAVLGGFASLVVAILLFEQVQQVEEVRYSIGNWAMPLGIEYRIDAFSSFILLVITGVFSLVSAAALHSIEREIADDRIYIFYAAWLLNFAGLLGILITGDVFNLFVFIEISSLSTYGLVALGRSRKALMAAFRYLIQGTIGATFILIGIGLMYAMTGTLNMQDLASRLPEVADTRTIHAAFAFFTVGVALKLALFPLHQWMPDAYAYAPSVVSSFLAASTTKVFAYVMIRGIYSIFGMTFLGQHVHMELILISIAMVAAFIGSAVAIFQRNIKRLLAWSSVAQIGYIVIGASLFTVGGLSAGILHMFNHALMKCALFLAISCVVYRTGSVWLHDMRGLGRSMPWTMSAFTLAALSLIGIPLTAGFVSKWYLIRASMEAGYWPVAVLIVTTSLMAIAYMGRIMETVWLFEPENVIQAPLRETEAPLSMLIPLWVLVIANLYFGVDASFTGGTVQRAAEYLFTHSP